MEYKLITISHVWSSTRAFEELTRAVNEALASGWEPLGGVVSIEHRLIQTMIKRR
jgi:hypothetical protein